MNFFDIVIILLLVCGGIAGFKNGFIKEIIGILCLILSFIIAYFLKDYIASFMYNNFDFLKLTGMNILIYKVIAFIIILLILELASKLIIHAAGVVQKIIDATIILTIPSKILGFIIGVVKFYILIFVALLAIRLFNINSEDFKKSVLAPKILDHTIILSKTTENIRKSIDEISAIDNSKDRNEKILETLENNKIITKEEVEKILDKIKDK